MGPAPHRAIGTDPGWALLLNKQTSGWMMWVALTVKSMNITSPAHGLVPATPTPKFPFQMPGQRLSHCISRASSIKAHSKHLHGPEQSPQTCDTHLGTLSRLPTQTCWGGTVFHFLASTTIASASTRPKPYRWLTGKREDSETPCLLSRGQEQLGA